MSKASVNIKGKPHKYVKKGNEADQARREEEVKKSTADAPEQKQATQGAQETADSPSNSKKPGKSNNNRKNKKGGSPRRRVPMSPKGGRRKGNAQNATDAAPSEGEHKLHSAWTIHVNKKPPRNKGRNRDQQRKSAQREKQSTDEYLQSLKELGTFDTIEDFWKLYSHLKPATEIPQNYVLSVFRKKLAPAWETFPNGGCWIIRVSRDHNDPNVLNRLWEELLFAVIGEAFKTPDLAGVMLLKKGAAKDGKGGQKARNRDAVTIWNAGSSPDSTTYMKIGERLRSVCNLDKIGPRDGSKLTIEYKRFRESLLRDKSTTMNARKYVYQPLYT